MKSQSILHRECNRSVLSHCIIISLNMGVLLIIYWGYNGMFVCCAGAARQCSKASRTVVSGSMHEKALNSFEIGRGWRHCTPYLQLYTRSHRHFSFHRSFVLGRLLISIYRLILYTVCLHLNFFIIVTVLENDLFN